MAMPKGKSSTGMSHGNRTGLFRSPSYWATMAISLFFMVLVDGWLTKLSAPIVRYDDDRTLGIRFPWDIPVEDFVYGYALLTLVLLLWERAGGPTRGGEAEEVATRRAGHRSASVS